MLLGIEICRARLLADDCAAVVKRRSVLRQPCAYQSTHVSEQIRQRPAHSCRVWRENDDDEIKVLRQEIDSSLVGKRDAASQDEPYLRSRYAQEHAGCAGMQV